MSNSEQSRPGKLLDQVRQILRVKHYSIRTEEAYVDWIRRFILFHGKRHPRELNTPEIQAYLTHLAADRNVAASTQNQAYAAILFLYREVLLIDLTSPVEPLCAKRPHRLPVVLTRDEVRRVLDQLAPPHHLMASLLYGAGLRLMECVRLRVKDLDFEQRLIVVRDGKGQHDRITMLPQSLIAPLRTHLQLVQALHQSDLAQGLGAVYLPYALERKLPAANREWVWQYVFPSDRISTDPRSDQRRRHHLDESGLQRAVTRAVRAARLTKRATCHTFRHSFATHILEARCL